MIRKRSIAIISMLCFILIVPKDNVLAEQNIAIKGNINNTINMRLKNDFFISPMANDGTSVTKTHTINSKDKAQGVYSEGVVWDHQSNRISLGGYLFYDDFKYPKGAKVADRWDFNSIISEVNAGSLGEGKYQLATIRDPNDKDKYVRQSILRDYYGNFNRGVAEFQYTSVSGYTRVLLDQEGIEDHLNSSLHFNIRASGSPNDVTLRLGANSDKVIPINGTIDNPRNGFQIKWNDLRKRHPELPRNFYGSRLNYKLYFSNTEGIDVYINDILITKKLWKEVMRQYPEARFTSIGFAAGYGAAKMYGDSGDMYVHHASVKQLGSLEGSYTSKTNDISFTKANQGVRATIDWDQSNTQGTGIQVETRARENGGSWSDWKAVSNGGNVSDFPKLKSGNVQFRVHMKTNDAQKNPWIKNIRFRIHGDTTAPTATFSPNSKSWTNDSVSTTIKATDSGGSGFKHMRTRKASGDSWGGWSGWTSSSSKKVSMSGTGNRRVQVEVEDNAGNKRTVTSGTYKVDKIKPNATFSPNSKGWTNNTVSTTIKATDSGGSGVKRIRTRKKNGNSWSNWSGWTNSSSKKVSMSGQGKREVQVEIEDNAGNRRIVTSGIYKIDKTKPNATFSPNSRGWKNTTATTEVKATDSGGSGFKQMRTRKENNGSWGDWSSWTSSSSKKVSMSGTGNRRVQVEVHDNAGNKDTFTSGRYYVDKTTPSATFSPNSRDWDNTTASTTINTKSPGGSGIKRIRTQKENNGSWSKWSDWTNSSSKKVTMSEDGVRRVRVEIEDNAGNKTTVISGKYKVDKTKPEGKLSPHSTDWNNKSISVVATGTDSLSGVEKMRSRVSLNGTWKSWSEWKSVSKLDLPMSSEGKRTLEVQIKDKAGNVQTIKSGEYLIDKTAPKISFNSKAIGKTEEISDNIFNGEFSLGFDVKDKGNGISGVKDVKYAITSSASKPTKWTRGSESVKDLKIDEKGIHYLHVESTDIAGNKSYEYKKFDLENEAPSVELEHETTELYEELITIEVKDKEKDLVDVKIDIEGPKDSEGNRGSIEVDRLDDLSGYKNGKKGYLEYEQLNHGDEIKFSFEPRYIGKYKITVKTRDKYNDWGKQEYISNKNNNDDGLEEIIKTKLKGQVRHTNEWDRNRRKFNNNYNEINGNKEDENSPRGKDMFFPGEKFMLFADPEDSAHQAKPDAVKVYIYEGDKKVKLHNADDKDYIELKRQRDNTWKGSYWNYRTITWKQKDLVFKFIGEYPNGKNEEDDVNVEINIGKDDYFRLHQAHQQE